MNNLKLRKSNIQNKIQVNPILQPRELSIAEEMLIRDNQQTFKNQSRFNVLKRELNIVSKINILKCEGRLRNAPVTHDIKIPNIYQSQSLLSQINSVGCSFIIKTRKL